MMSLVSYDGSSDSEEDYDNESSTVPIKNSDPIASTSVMISTSATPTTTTANPEQIKQLNNLHENGTNAISDDEDEIIINKNVVVEQQQQQQPNKRQLNLPPPSSSTSSSSSSIDQMFPFPDEDKPLVFKNLPTPKCLTINLNGLNIEEEDDEFLRKKAIAIERPQPKKPTIQILIPTLKELDDDVKPKGRLATVQPYTSKNSCGLLNLLPKPKGSIIMMSTSTTTNKSISSGASTSTPTSTTTSLDSKKNTFLIPDSVKNKQKAAVKPTKNTSSTKPATATSTTTKDKSKLIENYSDDEEFDDDDDGGDFFSLNSKHDDVQLPEISQQEINAMIVKKQTQMSQASNKYVNLLNNAGNNSSSSSEPMDSTNNNNNNEDVILNDRIVEVDQQPEQMNQEAFNALCGSSHAKRTKFNDINIVDVSMDDILPKREEWLRTQIQHATGFNQQSSFAACQPIDMDLQPGTKRKHQITYLAHQAKANEDALQATWANNRHARRQTQNKYGF